MIHINVEFDRVCICVDPSVVKFDAPWVVEAVADAERAMWAIIQTALIVIMGNSDTRIEGNSADFLNGETQWADGSEYADYRCC